MNLKDHSKINADKLDGKHASNTANNVPVLDGNAKLPIAQIPTGTSSSSVATGNHTHNYAGSSSAGGSATSAEKLSADRKISLTGDATGSVTFNGSADASIATTLSNSGVTAGSYGPSANATPAHNATFSVPYFTVDAKGRVTAASTKTITLPADNNTDTKVKNTLSTTTKAYLTGTTSATTNTGEQVFDTGVYLSTNAGELVASKFVGSLSGNATSATKATQDSAGLNINTTYIKALSVSDTTITYTKGDDSTGTITTKDTTYSTGTTDVAGLTKLYTGTGTATDGTMTQAAITTALNGKANASHGTHVTWATEDPQPNGTAAVGTVTRVAREDHVHPLQTSVSGNAGTATKLATSRTISLTGDATGSVSFNGSANAAIATTLASSGVTAGSYGPSANVAPDHSGTFSVPYITVDAKGRVTAASTKTITLPADNNTTYSTGTTSVAGLTKLYTGTGTATDGTMTQAAITTALNGKANSSHGTHVTWATTAPLANGTAAVGTVARVAREDHVHPLQTSVSGNAGTATKLATARTITVGGVVKGSASFDGSANISITTTANDITTINKSLKVTTDWMDVGITGTNLSTGTYAVQMFINDATNAKQTNEYYSGIMSWFQGSTTADETDELLLHKAGSVANSNHTYLRTVRQADGVLKLQIAATTAFTAAANVQFKFKKLI